MMHVEAACMLQAYGAYKSLTCRTQLMLLHRPQSLRAVLSDVRIAKQLPGRGGQMLYLRCVSVPKAPQCLRAAVVKLESCFKLCDGL